MRSLAAITATLAAAMVLSGCGGGEVAGELVIVSNPTTVGGVVAKGLVKQARVLACRIANGVPEPDASCATGTTGSDGSYRITFADRHAGPALIKVVPGAGSMMSDESTGADVAYDMTMRAVVPAVSSTTTAHVTPFSEMAASAASMNTMNATSINQAIAAVETAMAPLGIDMRAMPMIDLKDDGANATALTMQSNMVRQLSRVTLAAKHSNLLRDANGVPCNVSGTTASQRIACAVSAMAGVMTGYASADPTKAANLVAALKAQDVTDVYMSTLRPDGTISTQHVDMTSYSSMQTVLQTAGLNAGNAANMANMMMNGMH